MTFLKNIGYCILLLMLSLTACAYQSNVNYVTDLCDPINGDYCQMNGSPCGVTRMICCKDSECRPLTEEEEYTIPICSGIVGTCHSLHRLADGSYECHDVPWHPPRN